MEWVGVVDAVIKRETRLGGDQTGWLPQDGDEIPLPRDCYSGSPTPIGIQVFTAPHKDGIPAVSYGAAAPAASAPTDGSAFDRILTPRDSATWIPPPVLARRPCASIPPQGSTGANLGSDLSMRGCPSTSWDCCCGRISPSLRRIRRASCSTRATRRSIYSGAGTSLPAPISAPIPPDIRPSISAPIPIQSHPNPA